MTHTTRQIELSDSQTGQVDNPRNGLRGSELRLEEPRRRQMRFACSQLQVHSPVFGWAVELSAGGLRLESPATLLVGARYVFRLNYGARFLNLPGRVVWCRHVRTEITERGARLISQVGIELQPGDSSSSWRAALANRANMALGI